MEKNYPIKIVQGNYFAIALPLSKIVWSNGSKVEQPLVPNKGDLITVNLVSSSRRYDMRKIYVEDNVVHYECNEYLDLGTYSIELRLILVDGKKYRSYQRNKIQIVATNEEADIKDGNEFGVDTYEISSAVILYAKGDKGDQGDRGPTGPRGPVGPAGPRGFRGEDGQDGLSAYEIAVEQGFVGTEEEWLLSLKGEKGEDGTTDYNELENTPTFKTINGETIIGEGDIVIEGGGGSSGEDGVGIEDITVQESQDDGGDNTITIVLTDGTTESFVVKNGSKGSLGIQGLPGADGQPGSDGNDGADGVGISSINVTENPNDGGNNVVTINLTEGNPVSFNVKNGSKGSDGSNGAPGANGSDGKSAYEIAVENGFVGDETAWLASLKGDQGIQGPQGQTGPQGPAGTTDYNNLDNKPIIDQTPTSGNTTHLVSSDGVYQYVDSICGAILTRLQGI